MKFHIKTFGCKVNQYESQLLREQLEHLGLKPASGISGADICLINSCTVTHGADADCRQEIRRVLKHNPSARILVTGCLAVRSPEEIKKVSLKAEIYPEKERIPSLLAPGGKAPGTLISYFDDHKRAFVKIQDGCDAFCSYCTVPYVRPKLWNKPKNNILKEIGALASNGYREITLCGIRLGKYNQPGGYGLPEIIIDILSLDNSLRLELSSLELRDVTDSLLEVIAQNSRVSRHLHIPLQSGDDEILKQMNRPYTPKEFALRMKHIRAALPGSVITTDVIVGFPGETDRHFRNTLEFIRDNKFDGMHIFRYSARPGTKCAKSSEKAKTGSCEIKSRASLLRNLIY